MMYELLILLIVAVFFLFGRGLFAGDAKVNAPWPKGPDGRLVHKFGAFEIAASKAADFIVEQWKLPYAIRIKKAWVTSQDIAVTNGITLNLQDDESTPNVVISDEAVAAITAGAGQCVALTVDIPNTILKHGAILSLSYASGASDDGIDVCVYIEYEPVYD
jgi:hypothetical protein